MNQEKIGAFIAALRKEKRLTQEQLAEKLGVNHRSVSRWENGENLPDVSLLQVISDEFGVSITELLEGQRASTESYFLKEELYRRNYELLIDATRKEMDGELTSEDEKKQIVSAILQGVACKEDVLKYKKGMRANPATDKLYPDYFLPPYNGKKKLPLAQGYMPKTHILYGNYVELELLRLLFVFAPENEEVKKMIEHTLKRLKGTCFGRSCTQGECFAAGICVLRFLAAVRPEDTEWIDTLLRPFEDYVLNLGTGKVKMGSGIPLTYLIMAFQDIDNEKTRFLLEEKKDVVRKVWH